MWELLATLWAMKVAGREQLETFCRKHTDARAWIEHWLAEAEEALWTTPRHIKRRYASASFLARNVVVFNVKGNSYRLETIVAYRTGVVLVTWIGTHAEYDARNSKH
jgi:mRNA interferase HigB